MDQRPSEELLAATHTFPGVYQIKAIGAAAEDFEARVVEAVVAGLAARDELEYSVRTTPGGRHVSLTLAIQVQTPDQVRDIYERIRSQEGLIFLL